MVSADVRAMVQERFPSFAYLLDVPQVGALLEQATNEGWSEGRFLSGLYATEWYRARSESARKMETLRNLDPASYYEKIAATKGDIQDMLARLGVTFTGAELDYFSTALGMEGRAADDEAMRVFMMNFIREHPERVTNSGSIWAQAQRADQIARQEFFFGMAEPDMAKFGVEAALGFNSEENFRQNLADWFATMNPHIADRLRGGETIAQIVNPFRDIIAKELELGGLEAVDMIGSNQWKWLTGMPDPTTGAVRLPTQQEVISAARKDTRWKGTIGATALGTDLVTAMTRKFGLTT